MWLIFDEKNPPHPQTILLCCWRTYWNNSLQEKKYSYFYYLKIVKLLNKTSLLSGALEIILSTCWHIHRLFQYRHNGNLSSGSTALPSSWRCIIATAPMCLFWGTDINWNFRITEPFSRGSLLQTDSSIRSIDVNVFIWYRSQCWQTHSTRNATNFTWWYLPWDHL